MPALPRQTQTNQSLTSQAAAYEALPILKRVFSTFSPDTYMYIGGMV